MTPDTLASAACDAAMGEAAEPSIMDRLAELEAQGRVLGAQQITLADLIARSAESGGRVALLVEAVQENLAAACGTIVQTAGIAADVAGQLGAIEKRLAAVERRTAVRVVPGRT